MGHRLCHLPRFVKKKQHAAVRMCTYMIVRVNIQFDQQTILGNTVKSFDAFPMRKPLLAQLKFDAREVERRSIRKELTAGESAHLHRYV